MVLAPEKQQLHARQRDERAERLADLDQLESEYYKNLEYCRRQVRKKSFTREITRARRYHEEKSAWEYLNNIVEVIHLYTWRKTATACCTDLYQKKRYRLEQDLRELDAQHRKERISLRYDRSTKSNEHGQDTQPPDLPCFLP